VRIQRCSILLTLQVGDQIIENVAWSYESPLPAYEAIRGFLAFYPGKVDACYVDNELVTPQPGDFYGGWITSDIVPLSKVDVTQ